MLIWIQTHTVYSWTFITDIWLICWWHCLWQATCGPDLASRWHFMALQVVCQPYLGQMREWWQCSWHSFGCALGRWLWFKLTPNVFFLPVLCFTVPVFVHHSWAASARHCSTKSQKRFGSTSKCCSVSLPLSGQMLTRWPRFALSTNVRMQFYIICRLIVSLISLWMSSGPVFWRHGRYHSSVLQLPLSKGQPAEVTVFQSSSQSPGQTAQGRSREVFQMVPWTSQWNH